MDTLNLKACENCNKITEATNLVEIEGHLFCEDCLREKGYTQCADCGKWFMVGYEGGYVDGVGDICGDCLSGGDYEWCDICEEYHPTDDMCDVIGRWHETIRVCSDCIDRYSRFQTCEECGDIIDTRYLPDLQYVHGVGYVCESCLQDYYCCEDCGEWYSDSDICYDDDEDEYLCIDCYNRRHAEEDNHELKRYSYKPTPKPRVHADHADDCTDVKDLLFGVELEVDKGPYDAVRSTISNIADASEDVYMKRDGSLDTGFEIVTHPCTLAYHMNDMAWRSITEIAKSAGFKSHDARTCGLHVHVGRYQLGDYTERENVVWRIVLLVYRHWDALVKFSRRNEGQLNHWATRPQIGDIRRSFTPDDVIRAVMAADNGNRYQAVNLCNSGTIEFRMFNGSLKRDTIIATLQLVSNICQYAMAHTVEDCLASKWADLTDYRVWDELKAYLAANDITTVTDPADLVLTAPADLHVGDRVRYASNLGGPAMGTGGTIVAMREGYTGDSYRYGVRFDGFDGGHNLGGVLDLRSNEGWWCSLEHLEPIAA